jgi:hypothetical protein
MQEAEQPSSQEAPTHTSPNKRQSVMENFNLQKVNKEFEDF